MAHADAHEHDDHGHAVADGDDLPHHGPAVEEPRSPAWLPFLGLALFGVLLVWWLSTPSGDENPRDEAVETLTESEQPAAAGSGKPAPPAPSGFKAAPTVTLNPAFRPK